MKSVDIYEMGLNWVQRAWIGPQKVRIGPLRTQFRAPTKNNSILIVILVKYVWILNFIKICWFLVTGLNGPIIAILYIHKLGRNMWFTHMSSHLIFNIAKVAEICSRQFFFSEKLIELSFRKKKIVLSKFQQLFVCLGFWTCNYRKLLFLSNFWSNLKNLFKKW